MNIFRITDRVFFRLLILVIMITSPFQKRR